MVSRNDENLFLKYDIYLRNFSHFSRIFHLNDEVSDAVLIVRVSLFPQM